jgi:alkylhydroperoxidase family enzyme
MAWIRVIEPKEVQQDPEAKQGKLAELYSKLVNPEGQVDNILTIHSLNPESLEAHLALYKTMMFGRSPLSRAQREMIAVVVSAANRCHY